MDRHRPSGLPHHDASYYSAGGLYTNFASDPEAAAAAFGANHQRLVDLKNKYDPQNFFRMNQNIKPTV